MAGRDRRARRKDGRPGGPSLPISPKLLTRKPGIEPWPCGIRHSVFDAPPCFRLPPGFVDALCNFNGITLAKDCIRGAVYPHDKGFTFFLGVRFGIGFAQQDHDRSPCAASLQPFLLPQITQEYVCAGQLKNS
jgi:hypothetical protein